MSVTVDLCELLDYSDHERRKWRDWLAADPRRFETPLQERDADFPTIGSLFDHIFLVERRHLARLEGGTPPGETGVRSGDWKGLFEYGDLVRADLRRYIDDIDATQADERMTVVVTSGQYTMTRRRLATHILLHEIRHLAQIALAARRAGHEPPGQHDIFYLAER